MNDDNNVPSRGAILLANARGAPKPRLHWSNVLQYGEALKEAAINAKPELIRIQGRIVALLQTSLQYTSSGVTS
jgi:hypothetical protein